jgi:hypothetical protein
MEVVAGVSSIAAIVQLADRIVKLCKFYIGSISDAPSDLRTILIEISTIKSIFESLEFLNTNDETTSALLQKVCGRNGPVDGCQKSLLELEKLFPSHALQARGNNGAPSKTQKVKASFATLAYPFQTDKAQRLLQQIMQYKSSINIALTAELTYVT